MTVRMLVVLRIPIAAALAALLATTALLFALSAMGNEGGAADLAGVWDRRPDSELLPVWLAQYSGEARRQMRDWLSYHDARVSAGVKRLRVETSSGPGTDGWFRIEVDRPAGRVAMRCGGSPASGCARGRWRLDRFGLVPADLLR